MNSQTPPPARTVSLEGANGKQGHWAIPEEIPVAFVYNGRNYAVMLATPKDLTDLAFGFSLTEEIVRLPSDLNDLNIHTRTGATELRISISRENIERLDLRQRRRNLVGRAGCGLCGLDNAESFFQPLPRRAHAAPLPTPQALARAEKELTLGQKINQQTKSVHGAAWANLDGTVTTVREDVGRHNALDKLLGARARARTYGDGFVIISSRCSYEIVEKSARCNVGVIAALSGPTAFAVRKAQEADIALFCRSKDGFLRVGNHDQTAFPDTPPP